MVFPLAESGIITYTVLEMKSIIEIIVETLSNETYIQFVYLFGSMARGNAHPLSDYDIAVFIDKEKEPSSPYGIKSHITAMFAGKLPTQKVEIVILNSANPFLAFEAVDRGKLVFKKDPKILHDFVFRMYQRYFDNKGLYRLQEEKLLRRIKNGTYGS